MGRGYIGRRAAAAALVCASLAAGCTGHSSASASQRDLDAIVDALVAARTAHVQETATPTAASFADGDLDFVHDRARFRGPAIPKYPGANVVLYEGDAVLTSLAGGVGVVPATVAKGRHWLEIDSVGAEGDAAPGFDPLAVLRGFRDRDVTIHHLASTRIGGVVVRHMAVDDLYHEAFLGQARVVHVHDDLYVDRTSRLVRLVQTEREIGGSKTVRSQFDFSRFGAPMRIRVPARSDVVVYSDDYIPTPQLQGGWTNVASGVSPGFTWKLFRSAADGDRECWSFEAKPALVPRKGDLSAQVRSQLRAAFGATGPMPQHDGHDAVCSRTGAWRTDLQTIAEGNELGKWLIVVVLAPDVVSVRRVGQSLFGSDRVPIDARFHGFVEYESFPMSFGQYALTKRDGTYSTCTADLPTPALSSPASCGSGISD